MTVCDELEQIVILSLFIPPLNEKNWGAPLSRHHQIVRTQQNFHNRIVLLNGVFVFITTPEMRQFGSMCVYMYIYVHLHYYVYCIYMSVAFPNKLIRVYISNAVLCCALLC